MSAVADDSTTTLKPIGEGSSLTLAAFGLRCTARRIAASCEGMLEFLAEPEQQAWRDFVVDALSAAHLLMARALESSRSPEPARPSTATAHTNRIREEQQRILQAMNAILLRLVAVTPEEQLLVQEAHAVRDAAKQISLSSPEWNVRENGDSSVRECHAGVQVLVVDDDRAMRQMLSRILVRRGLAVTEAESAEAALKLLLSHQFALLITDINMPQMSGLDLLRDLRARGILGDLPVIVLSSQDDVASVAECIELGAEDHIAKPFEPRVLEARITSSLDRKRLRDEERAYRERVAKLTKAAEDVERQAYVVGSASDIVGTEGELGRLARVFDRMLSGVMRREERLRHRVQLLRAELEAAAVVPQSGVLAIRDGPFVTGELVNGRYEIFGIVGRGGMGTVYRARDRELGEDVAIKVVREELIRSDPSLLERLKSEIRLMRRISHGNVVRAYDLGESRGVHFITMEFVRGVTLSDLLDVRGRLTVEAALAVGIQLCDALAAAHEQGIIHRDIKTANLFLTEGGLLKVMDFGLARQVDQEQAITMTGFIVGTPQYMSPEQLMGGAVDAASDMYSTGVVLYECLSGRTPYASEQPGDIFAAMVRNRLIPLDISAPHVTREIAEVVHQLLAYHPVDRLYSAKELAERFTQLAT